MAKAKFRMVHTAFWNDPTVSEEMTPEDKYFFLYLLTNEHTTQIGIYGISKKQMAFDMGYSIESINALMQRFIDHHKLIRYNAETREIAIKNWGKYNFNRGGKPVLDCVKSELRHVKDIELIPYVGDSILNEPVKAIYDTWYESLTIRGQEEEEEEEKEEEKEEEEEQKIPLPPSSLIDHEFLKIKNHFETHVIYQPAAYVQVKAISDWMDDGYQPDLIIKAMDIAVERGKPAIPYINGILKTWKADGIVNIQQLLAKEAQANGINTGHHARHNGPSTNPAPSIITKRSSLE